MEAAALIRAAAVACSALRLDDSLLPAAGAHVQGEAAARNARHPEVRAGADAVHERQRRCAPDACQGLWPPAVYTRSCTHCSC